MPYSQSANPLLLSSSICLSMSSTLMPSMSLMTAAASRFAPLIFASLGKSTNTLFIPVMVEACATPKMKQLSAVSIMFSDEYTSFSSWSPTNKAFAVPPANSSAVSQPNWTPVPCCSLNLLAVVNASSILPFPKSPNHLRACWILTPPLVSFMPLQTMPAPGSKTMSPNASEPLSMNLAHQASLNAALSSLPPMNPYACIVSGSTAMVPTLLLVASAYTKGMSSIVR